MRNHGITKSESRGVAFPLVIIVSAGPIVRHSLEARLAAVAEVRSIEYRSPEYAAACELDAQIVVADLTNLRYPRIAHAVASDFAGSGSHLVFLGYGKDEADERSVAEELNALFNPGLEGVLELLTTPRRPATEEASCAPPTAPVTPHSRPGSPAGRGVASRDDLTRGKGEAPMDLVRQLHIRLANLSVETEEGQTLVEYGLILALISVVAIAALSAMGTGVINTLSTVTAKL